MQLAQLVGLYHQDGSVNVLDICLSSDSQIIEKRTATGEVERRNHFLIVVCISSFRFAQFRVQKQSLKNLFARCLAETSYGDGQQPIEEKLFLE